MEGLGDRRHVARLDPGSLAAAPRSRRTGRDSACRRTRHTRPRPVNSCSSRSQAVAVGLQRSTASRSRGRVGGRRHDEERADEVVLDVGDQAAQRADHAGTRRDQHALHAELARQEAAQHRAGAAERQQGEVARVDAVARDELVDLDEHAGDGDADDRLRGLLEPEAELRLASVPMAARASADVEAERRRRRGRAGRGSRRPRRRR